MKNPFEIVYAVMYRWDDDPGDTESCLCATPEIAKKQADLCAKEKKSNIYGSPHIEPRAVFRIGNRAVENVDELVDFEECDKDDPDKLEGTVWSKPVKIEEIPDFGKAVIGWEEE